VKNTPFKFTATQLIKRIFLDDFERPKLTVASVRKDRIEMANSALILSKDYRDPIVC